MRHVLKTAAAAALSCAVAAAPASPPQAPGAMAAAAPVPASGLAGVLASQAPTLDRHVLALATEALQCARHRGEVAGDALLSVIDYSRPSTERRLWVFDLRQQRLLFQEWVAHGRNTGADLATRFSNDDGSYMSSLGAFVAEDAYTGHNGYSLRLKGLEPGFNDRAHDRAIVIHGAPYVSEAIIRSQGRLGRSLGCPAVRPAIAHRLIDAIRGGSFVFAYYPDPDWLRHSRLLGDCGAT
ncbi:murein L,D-transpeptidase catalytic domain family protein [[Pseudomonas] boreopolis]|uniref:murein L,D-transpeptidase catalytic domain family protein n=1 Tax=Xanthomonas boreopolis TaxID=86183 RepID=UPI003D9BA47E